ncbi:MAG: hypothetical protein HOD58_02405 [Gammaproteobacteria bacterium]|nr:hypothetical protein [Gammaproteobacteria bacterium]MBT4130682.1 hypothetical protein [Candidatus Neomarinimicrobiota bacterium]MBT4328763.1 hypothetical protein [Gammaproteobacteria bacterium]
MKSIDFGVIPGHGRLARIHYLSEAGKRTLISGTPLEPHEILAPAKNASLFQRDYFHRIATIQFNIQFQQWLASHGYTLVAMELYFNRQSIDGQYRSATRTKSHGRFVEPDAVGVYRAHGLFHTFLFEQHNGKDAKRAIRQIEQHCLGLSDDSYAIRLTQNDTVHIVYVFQNPTCMSVVMKAMLASP